MKYLTPALGMVSLAIASLIAPPAHADIYLSVPSIQRQTYPTGIYPTRTYLSNFNGNGYGYSRPNSPTTNLYRGFQIPSQIAPSQSQQVITFPSVRSYQPYPYPVYSYPTYAYPVQSYTIYNDPSDPYQRNSYSVYTYPVSPTIIYRQRY